MTIYSFDNTLDGLLTAVFEAFALHEQPEMLLAEGDPVPLFCERLYQVPTDEEKAGRVWKGLEKRLPKNIVNMLVVSWLSELPELHNPLFHYICKVFRQPEGAPGIEHNFADPDVLSVTNIARKVLHEGQRMKQFIRFQKAKDGTYLKTAPISPSSSPTTTFFRSSPTTSLTASTTSRGLFTMPNVITDFTTTEPPSRSTSPLPTSLPWRSTSPTVT